MRAMLLLLVTSLSLGWVPPSAAQTTTSCDTSRPTREFMDCVQKQVAEMNALSEARKLPGGWEAGCAEDRVTLEWTCFAVKWVKSGGSSHSLRVDHHASTGYCVTAPANTHPGSEAVIRIGDNSPIRYEGTAVCGEVGATIIEQLLTGADGAARGTRWPAKTEEFEFSAAGFTEAWAALQDRVADPRP